MNKKFLGIMIAAICMTTAITGCTTTDFSSAKQETQYISPDEEFVFDNDTFTVKKLFEGAMETVRYSKYLKISGDYDYSYSNDIGVVAQSTNKKISSEGPFECEIYRDENGNFSSVLNGEVTYDESMHSNMLKGVDYQTNKQARYTYYKTGDDTDNKDKFIYYGDGDICGPIDVERILMLDIDERNIEQVTKNNDVYTVRTTGKLYNAESAVSRNFIGSGMVDAISYYFDCASHELVEIRMFGSRSDSHESNGVNLGYESKSYRLTLAVSEVSYKETELPEIPQNISDNGLINDILIGKAPLLVKDKADNPFDIQNEFYSVASAIWDDVIAMPEDDRNTVTGLKKSIAAAAESYDIDAVDAEYALIVTDLKKMTIGGAMLHYSLSSQGEDRGYIMIPIVCYSNDAIAGNTILLDANDYGKVYANGNMQFEHDFTPSCQYFVYYSLEENGTCTLQYSEMKENKLSNLSDQAEVVNFPEEDWESLKKLASELDVAKVSSGSLYKVRVIDFDEVGGMALFNENYFDEAEWTYIKYYVIDETLSDTEIDELTEKYSLNFVSESDLEEKLSKSDYSGSSISWVQIPGE